MKKLITTLFAIATILVVSCADGDSDSSDTTTTTTTVTPLSTLCLYYTPECGNTEEFVSSLGVTLKDGKAESVNKELSNYVRCINSGTMILLDPVSGHRTLVCKNLDKVIFAASLDDNSKVPSSLLCPYYTYKCGNNEEFVSSLGVKLKDGEVTVTSVNKELYNYVYCINSGTMILLDPDSGHRGLVSKYNGKVILKAWLDDN